MNRDIKINVDMTNETTEMKIRFDEILLGVATLFDEMNVTELEAKNVLCSILGEIAK